MASIEKDAIKGLRSLSECCICLTTYTDPRILSCFHTCCLKCFENIQKRNKKKNGDVLPCPMCRKEFTIPPEGMKGLQKNFFIESVIEMTKALNSETKTPKIQRMACSMCSLVEEAETATEAEMRCLNCCENYCLRCSKIHQGQKLTRDHKIEAIQSVYQEEDIVNMFPIRKCTKHSDKALDYYCSDCKTVVCVSCLVGDHQHHKCKDVKTVDEDFRETLAINCANVSDYSEQMQSKKMDIEKQRKEYLEKIVTAEKAIITKSQQLKELIDQHSKILLDELSMMKQKHQKIMEIEIEDIERKKAFLDSFVLYCTELRSKGSPSQVCSSVDILVSRAKGFSADNDKLFSGPSKLVDVEFIETDQKILNAGNVIGKLSESERHLENCAIVIGRNDGGGSISNEISQINLNRPKDAFNPPPVPTKMQIESAAAVYCNSIYVTGIGNNSDEIWKFDGASSSWKQCASLIRSRMKHCVAFVDQVLYICGGFVGVDNKALDDVEAYDAINDKCATVGKLNDAVHSSHNCVYFKDSLYIFGGCDVKGKVTRSVQVYDTKSNTSSVLSNPMPRPDALVRAVLWNNSVIILGCYSCFIYNFDTEIWQLRDRFKTDVFHFGLSVANGRIFVIGGGEPTTDAGGKGKWNCRDDVRSVPISNFLNDKSIEWRHHAKLPWPSLVQAFAEIKISV